jgi:hypothetical protein
LCGLISDEVKALLGASEQSPIGRTAGAIVQQSPGRNFRDPTAAIADDYELDPVLRSDKRFCQHVPGPAQQPHSDQYSWRYSSSC